MNFIVDQDIKPEKMEGLQKIITLLGTFKAKSIKTEYLLEERGSLENSQYDFSAIDIKSAITEFIKMTDYDNKEEILEEISLLYDKCKTEEINDEAGV